MGYIPFNSTPSPDSTLSVRGVAADSAVVGDRLAKIEENYINLNSTLNNLNNTLSSLVNDLTYLRKEIIIKKNIQISTSWQTILHGDDLPGGTYVVSFASLKSPTIDIWGDTFCGLMQLYSNGQETNNNAANEINLHCAGHATNGQAFYLRTCRTPRSSGTNLLLQIRGSSNGSETTTFEFHFRRILNQFP